MPSIQTPDGLVQGQGLPTTTMFETKMPAHLNFSLSCLLCRPTNHDGQMVEQDGPHGDDSTVALNTTLFLLAHTTTNDV